MNWLERFVADGQKRTRWAAEQDDKVWNALDYYLGPTGIPDRLRGAVGLLDFTDAGDFRAVAEANRDFVADPSFGGAMNLVNTTGAAALPFATAKMYADGVDVFGDAIESGTDDLLRYFMDDDGAIRAWHGSPHDFDRFDITKIGTGEGAQAYGHGLYFAENEKVAKGYRDQIAGRITTQRVMVDGQEYIPPTEAHQRAAAIIAKDGRGSAYDVLNAGIREGYMDDETQKAYREVLKLTAKKDVQPMTTGRLYEVEIDANPEDFLDWDAPLSEQPHGNAIQEVLGLPVRKPDGIVELPDGRWGLMSGGEPYGRKDGFPDRATAEYAMKAFNEDAPADKTLSRVLGRTPSPEYTSERLREAGIPGIRYYDQGSRTAGEGTRNYVVFDDELVRIVKKYGIAGAAAMLGMSVDEVQARTGDTGQDSNHLRGYLESVGL